MNAVFAFAGGALFQGVVDLVTDPTRLLHGFAHGKDQAGDRHLGPLRQVETVDGMVTDAVAAAGFAEIRMTFARMDEHNGHLGLMTVTLPDHFGGGAQLSGGTVDGGG